MATAVPEAVKRISGSRVNLPINTILFSTDLPSFVCRRARPQADTRNLKHPRPLGARYGRGAGTPDVRFAHY